MLIIFIKQNTVLFTSHTILLITNKKRSPIVTKIFITGQELIISTVFITQYYFQKPKGFKLISICNTIVKIANKWEFQQIVFCHFSDIDFKNIMNLYKICTAKPYSCLMIDTNFSSWNRFTFYKKYYRKNIKTNHDNWW